MGAAQIGKPTGTDELQRIEVGNHTASPRRARAELREQLAQLGWDPERVEQACLVVTELIANAVIHGGGLTSLRAAWTTASLRIEVGDASSTPPVQRNAGHAYPTGRGLLIVDSFADGWGSTGSADHQVQRKRVWCTIDRR